MATKRTTKKNPATDLGEAILDALEARQGNGKGSKGKKNKGDDEVVILSGKAARSFLESFGSDDDDDDDEDDEDDDDDQPGGGKRSKFADRYFSFS